MPKVVSAPVTVVEEEKVKINEFFGGASCNPCPAQAPISVAHVHAKAGFAEDWQAPAFDILSSTLGKAVAVSARVGALPADLGRTPCYRQALSAPPTSLRRALVRPVCGSLPLLVDLEGPGGQKEPQDDGRC